MALDRMHETLSNLLRDSAAGVTAQNQDVPDFEQMQFVEAACDALDNLITTARALR
jgi:hypothetical protein